MDTSFKVGDKVFSYARQEWGTVENINNTHYPVQVHFLSGDIETTPSQGHIKKLIKLQIYFLMKYQ